MRGQGHYFAVNAMFLGGPAGGCCLRHPSVSHLCFLLSPLLVYALCSTTVFSHAQTAVVCANCSVLLCTPTGGKTRLTEGCSFRKKIE